MFVYLLLPTFPELTHPDASFALKMIKRAPTVGMTVAEVSWAVGEAMGGMSRVGVIFPRELVTWPVVQIAPFPREHLTLSRLCFSPRRDIAPSLEAHPSLTPSK